MGTALHFAMQEAFFDVMFLRNYRLHTGEPIECCADRACGGASKRKEMGM